MESFKSKISKPIFYSQLEWLIILNLFLYILGAISPVYLFKASNNETLLIVQRQTLIIFISIIFLVLAYYYFKKEAEGRIKILVGWTFLSGMVIVYLGFSYVIARFFYLLNKGFNTPSTSLFHTKTVFGIGFYSLLLGAFLGLSNILVIGSKLQAFVKTSNNLKTPSFFSQSHSQAIKNQGMITCPFCGKQTPPDSIFCQECGSKLV